MTLAIDTDVFCKLGIAGLLDDTAAVFGARLIDCGRLPALTHMLRRGRLVRHYGADACDALLPQALQVPVVADAQPHWLDAFAGNTQIDPGEAQLYALAAAQPLIVLTGDKRGLVALKDVSGAPAALSGRIAVLESALLSLCERRGLDDMRDRMVGLLDKDVMIGTCFSPDNPDPRDGLRSYIAAISAEVYPLILWREASPA